MTPINWPDGWEQREHPCHADCDHSEVRTYVDEDKPDLRVQITEWKDEPRTCKVWCDGMLRFDGVARAEVERLLAENADRESERADLRDRVEKAEAAVGRVESLIPCAAEGCPCGGDRVSVPTHDIETALRGDQ